MTVALCAAPADAGWFFHRQRTRVRVRYSAGYSGQCPPSCGAPAQRAPQAVPRGCPGGVCPAPQAAVGDGPAAFLSSLNAWRASRGRGPLSYDANLAAFAASNNGIHTPHSAGGAAQTWAGTSSYSAAFQMWAASPSHASIMLSATQVVGVSTCETGCTGNFR